MRDNVAVIILAAGKGERMKSDIPKVLHSLCGRPMLSYVLDLARGLEINKIVIVLGYRHKEVSRILGRGIKIAIQQQIAGTADAVKKALALLKNFKGTVVVLYADNPLLKKETLKNLLEYHQKNNLDVTLLTAQSDKPAGYGRVLRDKYAAICGIAEEKDADDFQKAIKEINTGVICFKKDKLVEALRQTRPNNRKKEYYLTDTVAILYKRNCLIDRLKTSDLDEVVGINSRLDLARATKVMQRRINEELMKQGISIVDPDSAFISYGTKIGQETTIYPFTVIERNVKIGKRCSIGPFAHLRENTHLGDDVVVGNFIEIVRSGISAETLVKHFSYIGDSKIGRRVNIGAGTVTANFNGRKKSNTVIKDNAFIGSDTVLVAPVKVGKRAISGAGAVVLKNIPDGKKAVGVPAKSLIKKQR